MNFGGRNHSIDTMSAEIDRLRATRDELLAALKALVSRHEGYYLGMGMCVCEAHVAARAVIAKAEGKA